MGSYPAIPFELWNEHQPKTQIVVAVVRVVVVAIRRTAIIGVVVPAAAAIHAVGAPKPVSGFLITFDLNVFVCACCVKAINGNT